MNKFEQPPQPKKEETSLEEIKKSIEKGREKLLKEAWEKRKEEKEAFKKGETKLIREEFLEKEKAKEEAEKAKKEEQKSQAKEILKRFFEKEEEKKREILIDVEEQEKLIEEALREREAERLTKESPARESLEIAKKELLGSEELTKEEKNYLGKGELSEKAETSILAGATKWQKLADEKLKECDEIKKQIEEKGINVDKMAISLKERVKFSIKSLINKNLRNLRARHDMALAEAIDAGNAAQELRLGATDPKKYLEWIMERAAEQAARRKAARKAKELPKRFGLSPFEAGF